MGGKGATSGISSEKRESTRKEQWMQNAGVMESNPSAVKVGDSISTRIVRDDGSVEYEKWNFVASGTTGEIRYGTVKVTETKITAKTTKITAETPNGRIVTRTFKNSEDVFVFKKKKGAR